MGKARAPCFGGVEWREIWDESQAACSPPDTYGPHHQWLRQLTGYSLRMEEGGLLDFWTGSIIIMAGMSQTLHLGRADPNLTLAV